MQQSQSTLAVVSSSSACTDMPDGQVVTRSDTQDTRDASIVALSNMTGKLTYSPRFPSYERRPLSVTSFASIPLPSPTVSHDTDSVQALSTHSLRRPASISNTASPRSPLFASLRRNLKSPWASKEYSISCASGASLGPVQMADNIAVGLVATADDPCYISARSANSLISESRPTRIQTEALLVLNRLLDELLLLLLSSAKSLATDRIKSDGMLKLLNNNILAKDAVLEAELELRSYVEAKRSEGAKVPLGLMATSRLDGTEQFPVNSAYEALRIRCQYYSTLGDREDDSAGTDQNIMSTEGRPIATITQGVAIYVTALLEFVGEHILKSVAAVIERDNSDEASLYDLKAAITEDEQLIYLYNRMSIKHDLARRIEVLEQHRASKSDTRAAKPWQVPTDSDYDEAAGPALFTSQKSSAQAKPVTDPLRPTSMQSRGLGHGSNNGRASITSFATSTSNGFSAASTAPSTVQSGVDSTIFSADAGPRPSSERGWSGVFGGMKRRNSLRLNADAAAGLAKTLSPVEDSSSQQRSAALDPSDDFEALMMSGQTMKVSLTSNRLRTIEVAKEAEAKKNAARKRPGTATVSSALQDERLTSSPMFRHSLSQDRSTDSHAFQNSGNNSTSSISTATANDNGLGAGASSRTSISSNPLTRPERKAAPPPPSSYRGPTSAMLGVNGLTPQASPTVFGIDEQRSPTRDAHLFSGRLKPRDTQSDRMTAQELADLFQSTPPSAVSETFSGSSFKSNDMDPRRKVGDRVRNLFGRKSASSGRATPTSPLHPLPVAAEHYGNHSRGISHDTSATASSEQFGADLEQQVLPVVSSGEIASTMRPLPALPSSSTVAVPVSLSPSPDLPLPDVAERSKAPALGGVALVSRSLSQPHSIPETQEDPEPVQPSSSASVGIFEESAVPELIASPTIRARPATGGVSADVPSRKVQWGYKRNSSNLGHTVNRNGTPTSDRRRSGGYQSSNGHTLALRGDTPLLDRDLSSTPSPVPQEDWSNGRTFGTRPMHQRTATQESNASSLKAANGYGGRQVELVRVLGELEKSMRGCSSVAECRALVTKAIHAEAGLSLSSGSEAEPITHSPALAPVPTVVPEPVAEPNATSRYALLTNPPSASATSVDGQRLVFAWLLGGDESPHTVTRPELASDVDRSIDSQAHMRRYSSGVTSVQSNYRDAGEEPMQ